jgi:hypothetical protein
LFELASEYATSGAWDQAVETHRRALSGREQRLGPKHPETLESRHGLALAYASTERTDEAVGLLEATVADLEAVVGADHPMTTRARADLAALKP